MALEGRLDVAVDDDAVRFEFEVENAGDESVELTFPTSLKADFAVFADGEERWRASDGRMYAQVLESATLDPGETATYHDRWSTPEHGEYEAVATLDARERTVEARTTVSV